MDTGTLAKKLLDLCGKDEYDYAAAKKLLERLSKVKRQQVLKYKHRVSEF